MAAERPIIFSAPMIRAILAGRKTMTRRLATSPLRKCAVGDRLWVRETLRARNLDTLGALGLAPPMTEFDPTRNDICAAYAADGEPCVEEHGFDLCWLWKRLSAPAIHMPRTFCRLVLEVTAVKIERLQEIGEEDALAEGVERIRYPEIGDWGWPQRRFAELWNKLHGPDAWDANPEVVAITFRRCDA